MSKFDEMTIAMQNDHSVPEAFMQRCMDTLQNLPDLMGKRIADENMESENMESDDSADAFGEVVSYMKKDKSVPDAFMNRCMETLENLPDIEDTETELHSNVVPFESRRKRNPMSRKKFWSVFAVACAVLACGVAAAAAYWQWSRSIVNELGVDEEQLAELESEQVLAVYGDIVTEDGITVTAKEGIVSDSLLFLTFQVDGYEPYTGEVPEFEKITVYSDAGDEFYTGYGGFYSESVEDSVIQEFLEDGYTPDGSEGSMEYIAYIIPDTVDLDSLYGQSVHVELAKFSVYSPLDDGTSELVERINEIWSFDLTLPDPQVDTVYEYQLDMDIDNTNIYRLEVEISSMYMEIRYYYDGELSERVTPSLYGIRMKDSGDIYQDIAVSGIYMENDEEYVSVISYTFDSYMDLDELESLILVKPGVTDTEETEGFELTEENCYFISLE